MDFAKFYRWKKHAAIAEMANGLVRPTTCLSVYADLRAEGLACDDSSGMHALTEAGRAEVPASRRTAARLMNELIAENHKLVRKIVNQLFKRAMAFAEEEDLYQAGLMAFVHALSKFDPDRFATKGQGKSFGVYLRHWIRDYVQRDTSNQQTIKHPKGFGMPYTVYRKQEEILARTGKLATAEELGTHKHKDKEVAITEDQLNLWRSAQNCVVSMDAGWEKAEDEGASGRRHEAKEKPESSKSPESLLDRAQREAVVERVLAGLDPQERHVIEMMREGDTSARRIGKYLNVNDDKARLFKASLIAKVTRLAQRAGV